MTAKTTAARRAAFFAALAETGNQTLAAERAKVSRSWVQLHRSTDPAFRAEVEAAVVAAKARLDRAKAVGPQRQWRTQDAEELTVQGSRGRWTQVRRARLKQWTPRAEARFLRALKGSCNVKAACAEVGLSPASAYNHRARWAGFAERWDAAVEEGYDRLATAIVASAGAMLGDADMLPDPALTVTSVDQAIQALRLHKAQVTGDGRRPGRWQRPRSLNEVRGSIVKKLEAIQRAQEETMTPVQQAAWQAWRDVA